jgi:hypothetical protein
MQMRSFIFAYFETFFYLTKMLQLPSIPLYILFSRKRITYADVYLLICVIVVGSAADPHWLQLQCGSALVAMRIRIGSG